MKGISQDVSLEAIPKKLALPSLFEGKALGGGLLSNANLEEGRLLDLQMKTSEIIRNL